MSDREALYAAILAHPDDDTPRLVFADWLQENGEEEQAQFIRKQIELSRVPEWDALWVRARHFEPDSATGEKRPRPDAPEPIKWGGMLHGRLFRRGFPCAVSVFRAAPFWDEYAHLSNIAPVDEVMWYAGPATNHVLPQWADFVTHPVFARVRRFMPALATVSECDLAQLNDSPHWLRLDEFGVGWQVSARTATTLLTLPRFRNLSSLHLSLSELGSEIATAADSFTNHRLKRLRLLVPPLRERASFLWDTGILTSPFVRGLKELDLSENGIGPGEARQLAASPALLGLESLVLRDTRGGDELAVALAGCSGLSRLRRLVLHGNGIGPVGAQALAESPYLSNLVSLDLGDNPVGDEGAIALAHSPYLSSLLELDLLFGELGDTGATAILDSPLGASLVHLPLHRTTMYNAKGFSPITQPVAARLRTHFGDRVELTALASPD